MSQDQPRNGAAKPVPRERLEQGGGAPTDATSAAGFADLYSTHVQQVKAFLARTGCETHSIDDLVQETFLRAWSGRNQFSGRVQPRTWLFGIARNTARESWRRRMITQPLDAEASLVEYDHAFIDTEMKQSLRSAVRQLPPKQRIAISLVYFDGFTQIDAAARTACAHDAFRRRLASGRSRLRTLLNADHTA